MRKMTLQDLIQKAPSAPAEKEEQAYHLAAFEDYWNMGPGRSLLSLQKRYVAMAKAAKADPKLPLPPATTIATLEKWSSDFHWQDRLIHRQQREADLAEVRAVEALKKQKEARIVEAQALRSAGAQGLKALLKALPELDDVPLVGRMVYPEKGRPYRVDGLIDMFPKFSKAIEVGQRLERLETGEGLNNKLETVIEALIADLSPEEQADVRAVVRQVLADVK